MLSTSYFVAIFLVSTLVAIAVVHIRNKNAPPLKKAWNSYIAMSILHTVLFLGLVVGLPSTLPSLSSTEPKSENLQDAQTELKYQRRDIEELKNQIHQTRETVWMFAYIFLLFAPIIYYNLFKSNLEIEKLSGKKMGSFD